MNEEGTVQWGTQECVSHSAMCKRSNRGARGVQRRKLCHQKEVVQDDLKEQVLNWV